MEKNFVFLDEMLPGVRWDAKYATWDNFTGKPYCRNERTGGCFAQRPKPCQETGVWPALMGWLSLSVCRRLFSALGVTPGEQSDEKAILPKYKEE